MTIGASTTHPSDTGNIGLPAERSSTNMSSELEAALLKLPAYLPAFEPESWDDPAASQGCRRISFRSRGSERASLLITSDGSYRMISVESSLEYKLEYAACARGAVLSSVKIKGAPRDPPKRP